QFQELVLLKNKIILTTLFLAVGFGFLCEMFITITDEFFKKPSDTQPTQKLSPNPAQKGSTFALPRSLQAQVRQ
ncbi:MAG: hypothetical protein AAF934_02750, partial [Bacteroidota bacterium]